ncbi:MAG: hypothetical protein H0V25_01435 [Solirubrobacterales bacterium]|nr:hypothetical protein [Solirubrobacterales bacterium]
MDTNRLNQGEMIAAVSALVLLVVMFISWFGIDIPDEAVGLVSAAGIDTSANAWQSFSFIDIVLFVTILVAIGGALATANAQTVSAPVAISAITAALGILSVLLILFRIIDPPGPGEADIGRKVGVFLGLIAAAGIAYGGWRAMQEEGTSFAAQGDRLQNRDQGGPGAPPPAGPPAAGGGAPPPAV